MLRRRRAMVLTLPHDRLFRVSDRETRLQVSKGSHNLCKQLSKHSAMCVLANQTAQCLRPWQAKRPRKTYLMILWASWTGTASTPSPIAVVSPPNRSDNPALVGARSPHASPVCDSRIVLNIDPQNLSFRYLRSFPESCSSSSCCPVLPTTWTKRAENHTKLSFSDHLLDWLLHEREQSTMVGII